jgi:uncharacterized protein
MTAIGRPKKVRFIQHMPKIMQFSPRGKPGRPEETELTFDQFEAFKLADYQKFSQLEGARAMRISRPSFGRILRETRRKLADAIVNGKIIKIRLGDVQIGITKTCLTEENLIKELKRFEERHNKVVKGLSNCKK